MKHQFFAHAFLSSLFLGLASCAATDSSNLASNTSEKIIRVGGSAETYEIMERLADAYSAKTNDIKFQFSPPSQTSGGIKGVQTNSLELGGVSRVLTAEETNEALTYLSLSKVPVLVVAHDSVTGVTDISADQLRSIYKGEITNWQMLGGPDAPIALFDFPEDENEKQVLRQAYLGADLAITPDAIVFAEDDELIQAAATTDYSLAVIPFEDELEELPINTLTIDGIEPSPQNLESGKYPMALPLGLVLPSTHLPETRAFIDFIKGSEGQQILMASSYGADASDQ